MNTQHTPTPWRIRRYDDGTEIQAPLQVVCAMAALDDDIVEANARRIVACVNACEGINPEAVPDLLEVLKAFISVSDWWAANQDSPKSALAHFTRAANDARAAIAKAQTL